jgi:hypothetical protein
MGRTTEIRSLYVVLDTGFHPDYDYACDRNTGKQHQLNIIGIESGILSKNVSLAWLDYGRDFITACSLPGGFCIGQNCCVLEPVAQNFY